MKRKIKISLPIEEPKTWVIDIDGVVFVHNSYLDGEDVEVEGVREFIGGLPSEDLVILLTAREEKYRVNTEGRLQELGIRYDHIIFDIPKGERVLINDRKPDSTKTAFAVNTARNEFPYFVIKREKDLNS